MSGPSFPPLLSGLAAPSGTLAFAKALATAALGSDPGVVVYAERDDVFDVALILAPECGLEDAMAMLMVAGLGFADALGALAPPEVGVHLSWPGGIFVNGAKCGGLSIDASIRDPKAEPDWLVVGLSVPFFDDTATPGDTPDRTTLFEEGCVDITVPALIESWSRHTLTWINRWLDDGIKPVHEAWRAKARDLGEDTAVTIAGTATTGTFMGLDDKGGMLIRNGDDTTLIPLSRLLENAP